MNLSDESDYQSNDENNYDSDNSDRVNEVPELKVEPDAHNEGIEELENPISRAAKMFFEAQGFKYNANVAAKGIRYSAESSRGPKQLQVLYALCFNEHLFCMKSLFTRVYPCKTINFMTFSWILNIFWHEIIGFDPHKNFDFYWDFDSQQLRLSDSIR